ncbi:hypothetical protein K440DRAFT_564808, partial [Wilcoxina mikolae CBS 423.85]
KKWFREILEPYRERMLLLHNLPELAKLIVFLDCWSVHRGRDLAVWLNATYSWLIIIFVPANCTSVFQPCDVGLQRIFKHIIRQEASKFFIQEVQQQLNTGVQPENVKTSTALGILRDQTPHWIRTAANYLNTQPVLIKKAWSNCKTGDSGFNLSYECLSKASNLAILMTRSEE